MLGRPARRAPWLFAGGAGWVLLAAVAAAQAVPPLTGRVVDRADLLAPATEAALTDRLAAHEDSTGNQVAVLTVPDLGGEAIEPYATRVFRAWGLGEADRDNGVLLVVARDDRAVRVEVGYGLEPVLTDALADAVVRHEIVPRFRDGDFDGGVLAGVEGVLAVIAGDASVGATGEAYSTPPARTVRARGGRDRGSIAPSMIALSVVVAALSYTSRTLLFGPPIGWELLGMIWVVVYVSVLVVLDSLIGIPDGGAGYVVVAFVTVPLYVLAYVFGYFVAMAVPSLRVRHRHYLNVRRATRGARSRAKTEVLVDGRRCTVPRASTRGSTTGGSYGGRSSSSRRASSRGFSGRGGSSGGGGASGRW